MSGRDTGRTTRMCRMAHELAVRGKKVYVLVQNRKDQLQVMQHTNQGDDIRVEVFKEEKFDWGRMSFTVEHMPRGFEFDKVCVLVDHLVIQNKFPTMIAMYDSYSERRGHPRNSVEVVERLGKEAAEELLSV